MHHVYAIASLGRSYIYVGISNDVARRIAQHNNGYERTTRPYAPFTLIYTERATDTYINFCHKFWKIFIFLGVRLR